MYRRVGAVIAIAVTMAWILAVRRDLPRTAADLLDAGPTTAPVIPHLNDSDAKIEMQNILSSLDVPIHAVDMVASEMSFYDWATLRYKHSKHKVEARQAEPVIAAMKNTGVWAIAFHTRGELDRSGDWLGSLDTPSMLGEEEADASPTEYSRFRNHATGYIVGFAVLRADTGEMLENGLYNDAPELTGPPNVDYFAEIDALNPSN